MKILILSLLTISFNLYAQDKIESKDLRPATQKEIHSLMTPEQMQLLQAQAEYTQEETLQSYLVRKHIKANTDIEKQNSTQDFQQYLQRKSSNRNKK